MADVRITDFTDPSCPWAFSAEPFRWRLEWLYGDALSWEVRLVGLAETRADFEFAGLDEERYAAAFKGISRRHGMPIDTRVRSRLAPTLDGCRAVVAARRHDAGRMPALLRSLRVHYFRGENFDEESTLHHAAREAGIEPERLDAWMAEPETEAELRADMERARDPVRPACVLEHKLAGCPGGRRYTCPTYEIRRASDGAQITIPGFQPFDVYDVITANLVPDVERRPLPTSVEEVLEWSGTPLATKEVAVLLDVSVEEARDRLGRAAHEEHVGYDGFWSLDGA